ncbi:MAG: hypothetical protein QM621_04250 [Aeromicrobium sp.]|uniref:hypothetical protein n=1 Tax=Aeromicrobium sp. TaxID=1871063 RepID=UPI0039E49D92
MDLVHLAVVTPADGKRQERARRKCLERLLRELNHRGVTHAWIESRPGHLDAEDRAMVAALIGAHVIPTSFRVGFIRPLDEPMLWLPDAIAGLAADQRAGGSRSRDESVYPRIDV